MKALLVMILAAASVSWPSHPTLEQVEKAIQDRGAPAVVDELNHQQGTSAWESIEDRVAMGNGRWLRVAQQLRRYTDAGVSESLDNSMAEALPRNAEGVLAMLGTDQSKDFTSERVCSGETFIEVSKSRLRRHLRAGVTAVEKVSDPKLQHVKEACVAALNHDLK